MSTNVPLLVFVSAVDVEALFRRVEASALRPVVVDHRVLRRIIKQHRHRSGLGFEVPHGRCYALSRSALAGLAAASDLGRDLATLPEEVLFVARPDFTIVRDPSPENLVNGLWRATFHGAIHQALEGRMARGELTVPDVRALVNALGQTEMDEVRAVLRQDDLLLPPADDREVLIELLALFHELSRFAPSLWERMFPSLANIEKMRSIVGGLVDAEALIEASRPEGASLPTATPLPGPRTSSPTFVAPPTISMLAGLSARGPTSEAEAEVLVQKAEAARAAGNHVRAALSLMTAAEGRGEPRKKELRAAARRALEALASRLDSALAGDDGAPALPWISLLLITADHAVKYRGIRFPVEARLLFDVQRAALAHEEDLRAVDVPTWALSFGERPVVRHLPATRPLRVARALASAFDKVHSVRLDDGDRRLLSRLLRAARERAEHIVRKQLVQKLGDALASVGLRPTSLDESIARDKLLAELLDEAILRGFFGLPQLRDGLSRNQLKLKDLTGPKELWRGDPLLALDRKLAVDLDGVYRPGEIYLRVMQKASSIAFGTQVGRRAVLFVVLPFGGAYLALEGAAHIVSPISKALGGHEIHLVSWASFQVTSLLLFALIHSAEARRVGLIGLRYLGALLRTLFIAAPKWLFGRALVRQMLDSKAAAYALRHVIFPGLLGVAVYFLSPLSDHPTWGLPLDIALFVALSAALASRLGRVLFELGIDTLVRASRVLGHKVLPGLFQLIVDVFRAALELLERAIYRVDEALRFRAGEGPVRLYVKATLGIGWFFIAYVARLYATLLIEPEINPLKHFPVVTVAQKMMLPYTPQILAAAERPLAPLGSVLAGTVAGTTVFLLPSVFGFLAWELKENWKLYRATRKDTLTPVRVGPHGETFPALLLLGFHSGVIPKAFLRIRRIALKADVERAELSGGQTTMLVKSRRNAKESQHALHAQWEILREMERAVRVVFERELLALLARAPAWTGGPLVLIGVELSSNRIRVTLSCPKLAAEPAVLCFDEQSRWIVAGIAEPGFISSLDERQSLVLENALAGLYALLGVDLIREQLEGVLGPGVPYDIADDGLLVWPRGDYRTEVVYPLKDAGEVIKPYVRGQDPDAPAKSIDARTILPAKRAITWTLWCRSFEDEGPPPRLAAGPSLLGHRAAESQA